MGDTDTETETHYTTLHRNNLTRRRVTTAMDRTRGRSPRRRIESSVLFLPWHSLHLDSIHGKDLRSVVECSVQSKGNGSEPPHSRGSERRPG